MSRTSDEFISLGDRAKMANSYAPDVFVSIHQNSADATSANGIETYYHTNKSDHKPYAQDVQTKAIGETNARNRGVKSANFAVLRETNMPAALFESGFITNQNESANLASSSYQDKLATGIANGVEKYLKEKYRNKWKWRKTCRSRTTIYNKNRSSNSDFIKCKKWVWN
ncbi:N-acetylmuramoyl-L-alanine amidase [Paraclostridium bifermentans]|nr:N-acetylmuramoyl-L-alanine amidase [Paraclostridium bifermentans]